MSLIFEWDEEKAAINLEKHGVSFQAAFRHNRRIREREILVVVHTQQDAKIRIISAREATRRERQNYESK